MPPAQDDKMDATGLELRRVRNRELELKRISGEISCAECRRLKLKCDKKVPCSSCTRRGCKQICPTGTTTGSGSRQIIINSVSTLRSNESDTNRKLIAMSERIRALEDALQNQSDDSHPLLSSELLSIKQGIDEVNPRLEDMGDADAEEEMTGMFGTLSVSEGPGKSMRFLGATATDSALLMEVFDPASHNPSFDFSNLPPEIVQASAMWPFAPAYLSRHAHLVQIVSHLPAYERITSLTEAFFGNLAWMMAPIDRAQIVNIIVPKFYPQRRPISPELVDVESVHDLALLYICMACGAVADLTQPAFNPEGEQYQQLSRASLGVHSFVDYGSLSACQTLFLLGSYEVYTGRKTSQESSWKMMAMGMSHAASIGLHRDPSRWRLDPEMINRRRRIFWEIMAIDKWKCLGSGRPSLFPLHMVDCEFPLDRGATVEEDGTVIESVWQWRYRFARDILPILVDKLCAAKPPKYSEIIDLDRKVRDFAVHVFVQRSPKVNFSLCIGTDGDYGHLHPLVSAWWKEMALLYIHRNCFARAVLEYPTDPMRSPFASSFLASYRSATVILKIIQSAYERMALILERMWPLWALALSSGVIVGSVACRPSISFAASALNELEKMIAIFEKASSHPVARHGVIILYRLRDRANDAYKERDSQYPPSTTNGADTDKLHVSYYPRPASELGGDEEELNIMRGTTRYVEQKSIPSRSALQHDRAREYLTYTSPGPSSLSAGNSSAGTPSTSSSYSSAASSLTAGGNVHTPGTPASHSSNSSTLLKEFNSDSLLKPGSLVQTPPESVTYGDADENDWYDAGQNCAFDQYIPPIVEATSRNHVGAGTWPSAAHQDPAIASAQPNEHPLHHPEQANHAHHYQSQSRESISTSPFSGILDPVTPPDFSSDIQPNTNNTQYYSETSNLQSHSNYNFTPNPTGTADSFMHDQTLPSTADLNALYEKVDSASADAWRSFMQQFELTNVEAPGYNWEAMGFN